MTEEDTPKSTPVRNTLNTIAKPIVKLFDRVLPPYEPRIEIESKLIKGESVEEHAIVRHFAELQLVIGILLIPMGIFLRSVAQNGYVYFLSILGIVLLFSAYEMEEIYVTSHRIMIRRVGMIERIIRVPSDEEHATSHLVSFQVGRAPVNFLLVSLAGIGFLVIFNNSISQFYQLLVVLASTIILIFGLRINRRAVTIHLAGGLDILMGVRKGIPRRIVSAIQRAIYEDQPRIVKDEIPAKNLDEESKESKSSSTNSTKPKALDLQGETLEED